MKFFRIAAAKAAEENIIIIKLALYFRKAPRTRVKIILHFINEASDDDDDDDDDEKEDFLSLLRLLLPCDERARGPRDKKRERERERNFCQRRACF
jgi:hypothetical protein